MDFIRRRAVIGAIGAAVVVALIAVTIAATDNQPGRARAARRAGRTSTAKPTTTKPTTSSAATTSTTGAALRTNPGSVPIAAPAVNGSAPGTTTTPATDTEPPPTTVPSPWPPGTLLFPKDLIGSATFDPAEVHFDQPMAYTATITNPHDQWIFYDWRGSDPSYSDGIAYVGLEFGVNANEFFMIAPASDPVFRHETAQGVRTGLLLAPHASVTFTGQIHWYMDGCACGFLDQEPDGTSAFSVFIIFKPNYPGSEPGQEIPAGYLPITVKGHG
jgi:hypothetical protein